LEDLRLLPIPLPERQLQAELVDELSALLDATELLQKCCVDKMEALNRLKSSLLHQAFSGDL
jgi:type I restriction enzyme S subunit